MAELDGGSPYGTTDPVVTYSGGGPTTDFAAENVFTTVYASEFLPMVLPYAAGCPDFVAEQHIRLAAIEFCERTRCWRYIAKAAFDTNNETIISPDYATIHEIENAWWNEEVRLTPLQFNDAHPSDLTETTDQGGPPRHFTQLNDNSITVLPLGAGDLRLTVFLKPRSGSSFGYDAGFPLRDYYNQVPRFLFLQHAEAIANGALERILRLPGQDFSNPGQAAVHRQLFDQAMDKMFSHNLRGQQRARRRTKTQFC